MNNAYFSSTFIHRILWIAVLLAVTATVSARYTVVQGRPVSPSERYGHHLLTSQHHAGVLPGTHIPTPPGERSPAVTTRSVFLDEAFGTHGIVTIGVWSASSGANSVALQGDGKIVAAGYVYVGSNFIFALARYNTDGTLDGTFGSGGTVTTAIGAGNGQACSVAIQSNGKIVAAGYASNGSNDDFVLARYKVDGTLDSTFGSDGKVITATGSGYDAAFSVAVQSNGKIVAAGYTYGESTYDFALVRYDTNGVLDGTFGSGGKVITAIGSGDDGAYSVAIQSNGKIVAAGYAYGESTYDFALARYDTNGVLDGTFGSGGKVTTAIGSGDDGAYSVVVQGDGKIVAAGYAYSEDVDGNFFALTRYSASGVLDGAFGSTGIVTTAIGSVDDKARAVALQGDGKIIAAGFSYDPEKTMYVFAMARYSAAGDLDSTFDTRGTVTTPIGSCAEGLSIALQSDGKIVVAGFSNDEDKDNLTLARFVVYPVGIGTLAARHVGYKQATLTGAVNGEGVCTTVRFLYGPAPGVYTDSVGTSPATVCSDTGVPVSADVTGLNKDSTYYYTISASSTGGYFRGSEAEFTPYSNAGKALKFNNAYCDYVSIPGTCVSGVTDQITIEAWINPALAGDQERIVDHQTPGWDDGYILDLKDGRPRIIMRWVNLIAPDALPDANRWYHIAGTYDGSHLRLFVDGSLIGDSLCPGAIPKNGYDLRIGADQWIGECFIGLIEEVRIWNTALDSSHIRLNMHRALTGSEAGLIGYWHFNEHSGTTASDMTLGGNDGTLVNFTFDGTDGWVASTAPCGEGTSAEAKDFTGGTANLGTISLTMSDAFDNPIDLVATQITDSPDTLPTGTLTLLDDRYWVIDAFGSPGTFSANITFTVPSAFTNSGGANPSLYKRYTRGSTSDGIWTASSGSASGLTSTTVTFDGVASFSQLALGTNDPLPIQLVSFSGTVTQAGVNLEWTTLSEVNNYGFYVQRRDSAGRAFHAVSDLIPGAGTSLEPHSYSWTDSAAPGGEAYYRLRQVDLDGGQTYSHEIRVITGALGVKEPPAPREFSLDQNYPNPFNPVTSIRFSVEKEEHAVVRIYTMLGEEVMTVFDGPAVPGRYYRLTVDASGLSSGLYIYRIVTESRMDAKKMLVVK